MNLLKQDKTVDYYDRDAEKWSRAHGGFEEKSYWEEEMEYFRKLLPNGKIIEIGSGAGKDASALIKMGYEYTGTDASSGLIVVAQRRNPEATFINVAVHNLQFPEKLFDGFWTAATLLHIPKSNINSALMSINKIVKPGGIGFISIKEGDGGKEDVNTGRWFAYYRQQEFRKKLILNGFSVIKEQKRPGEKDTWLVYFIKKT